MKCTITFSIFVCFSVASGKSTNRVTENDSNYDSFLRSVYSSVYYDAKTNQTLKQLAAPYVPGHKPGAKQPFINLCTCEDLRCSCCAGIRIYGLGLDRQVCSIFTYEPSSSLIDFEFKMNDHSLFRNKFSTKEQQICVPVLHVGIIRNVKFCMKLYDISIVGYGVADRKLHACLNMITFINNVPFVTLQFDCMEMGLNGVEVLLRPETQEPEQEVSAANNSTNSTPAVTTGDTQENSDVYNPVIDDNATLPNNS